MNPCIGEGSYAALEMLPPPRSDPTGHISNGKSACSKICFAMSLFQGRRLEERLDRQLPADGRARLECEFFIEDLLTKKESGGAAKRSGDRIDVFAAIREFREFIQSSCLARVMA